ncbi:hypothetical protein VNO78_18349 [Psophocarpus tetragonolobus]|uniref:Uncharacterized protein n=1 Tax=Psophocarpus tetragonolobus TaxID=3891 RepID=A0AAN9XLF0_PSOTE
MIGVAVHSRGSSFGTRKHRQACGSHPNDSPLYSTYYQRGKSSTMRGVLLNLCKTKAREKRGIVIAGVCCFQLQQVSKRQPQQTSMASSYSFLFLGICVTLFLLSSSSPTADAGPLGMEIPWMSSTSMEEEFLMDSEITRRILATSKYISYGALQRNTVPCSRRGASYYNCQPGAQANPYSRGCNAITRCRS